MRPKSEDLFVLTSVLEFEDRFEGQIYHIGAEQECSDLASKLPAISYSGEDKVIRSCLRWLPLSGPGLEVGQNWMATKSYVNDLSNKGVQE